MALKGGKRRLIMQVSLVMAALAAAAAADFALPNCPDKCGNLTIPYPFGVTKNCSMGSEFFINCTANGTAFLRTGNILVTNISVDLGEIQVQQRLAYDCYDEQGNNDQNTPHLRVSPPYTISGTKNKFMAVGCDTYALIKGYRADKQMFITGCMSLCDSLDSVEKDSCSGIGCCQTSIPSGLKKRTVTLRSYYNHSYIWKFNPCSYAFIVQDGQFTFSGEKSFQKLKTTKKLPMIVNWELGQGPCDAAQKIRDYACKANTKCANRSAGYFCQCLPGYQGNPYLPDGCQDIDDCVLNSTLCKNGRCKNLPGSYSCSCNIGYKNQDTITCIRDPLKILLGITSSLLVLLVAMLWIYCEMKKRKFKKLKQKYFEDNGGLLLKQELASYTGSVETAARIFTEEELKKATNNYHVSGKIGEGGYGIVYKGTLSDERVVAIKKSKVSGPIIESKQFVNEVIVLTQIKHKNVVKLLGCCLETQVPILVYEFIANGTLYDHIHEIDGKKPSPPLPLALRLNIAADTAEALAYLHHSTSMPIVHRDVKTANILLDENFTAKVSDFGASRLVSEDANQISTLVQGTFGYLDPEYLQSNTLTEKSDVYSYGVVLVELLTSQKAISLNKPEAERNLANVFVGLVEEGHLGQILDDELVEGHFERVTKVAHLAKRCLRLRGEERPSMREVAAELEGLVRPMAQHATGGEANFCQSPKDTDCLLVSPASSAAFVYIRGEGDDDGGSTGIITSA